MPCSYLPVNLWGCDSMTKMGVYLCVPNTVVANQMFQQMLLPNQGQGE